MPKNKLTDLNNHLFEQLERLNDPELKGDGLKTEIERAKAMSMVASNIVGAAKVTVDALKIVAHGDMRKEDMELIFDRKQLQESKSK